MVKNWGQGHYRGGRARPRGLVESLESRQMLAPLAPFAALEPVPVEPDPRGGDVLAAITQPFASGTYSGVLVSNVIEGDASNPLGGLTFTYQLENDVDSANALDRLIVSSFAKFEMDVSRRSAGFPPARADRSPPEFVGFSFQAGAGQGPLFPGAQSSLLVVQTNASMFTFSNATVIGGSAAQVRSLAPLSTSNPPDAKDDTFNTLRNTPMTGNVLANDSDPDNDPLVTTLQTAPANGSVVLESNGNVTYTPNTDFVGLDTFTYTVSDSQGATDSATVTVNVSRPQNPPNAVNDVATAPANTAVQINVLANDTDPDGDNLTVISVGAAANGQTSIGAGGIVSYHPNPDFAGIDSFTYTIGDGLGGTDSATVTVIVSGDHALDANNDTAKVNEDSVNNVIDVLANDVDPEGDDFKVTAVTQGTNGIVTIGPNGANVRYTPDPDFSGTDQFTYTIFDKTGEMDTATVTVTVLPVAEGPRAVDDTSTVNEDSGPNVIDVRANDTHSGGLAFTISAVTQPANGTVEIRPGGLILVYIPDPNFAGTDTFTYTIRDSNNLTDTATVTVTVLPINEVNAKDDVFSTPIGVPTFFGSRGVLANDVDPEGDAIVRATVVSGPANGTLTLNADGSFSYTSNPGFMGSDSFTYTAFDALGASDTATATINVIDARPQPKNDAFSVRENSGPTFIDVLGDDTDPEGNKLRIVGVTQPQNGKVTIVADGLLYEPNPGFVGIDMFEYTVSDEGGGINAAVTNVALVTLFVHSTSAPYFPMDDDFTRPEDTVVTLTEPDLVSNDYNPGMASVDIASVTNPVGGAVMLNGDESVTFTPTPNFAGIASFNYRCAAPFNANMARVEIDFTQEFDPPVTGDDSAIVNENSGGNSVDVISNDVDGDGDTLLISAVTQGAHGSVAIGTFGQDVVYTPPTNFIGSDTFTYTVTDGNGGTDTATVTVAVLNVDAELHGTATDDVLLIRKDGGGTQLEVFANDIGAGTPIFSALVGSTISLLFDMLAGNDRLIVDLVNGNPLPTGGIDFLGGGNTAAGDQLILRNGALIVGSYLPSSTLSGEGVVTVGSRDIRFTGVEPIEVSGFSGFTAVTPNTNDALAVTQPTVTATQLSGTSGGVMFAPVIFSNVGTFVIDAAANDTGAGNDVLAITASGAVPNAVDFLEYQSGIGANTLDVQSGSLRIDSTVAAGGTLDTTVGVAAELITHRLRQTSLTLAADSRATVLSAGTLDAVSKLNALTIGTGGTLDINDNALVVDYTGGSPEAAIRAKIIEGRGGVGIGAGAWTGRGITSGAAAAANTVDPESRSIGYAENGALPLGAYTTFRGQPVDSTAVLIAFTRTGDANLDSLVNDDDATILGAFYPNANATWASADFEYTDTVDDNDATLLGAFYDPSAMPFPAAAPTAMAASAGGGEARDAIFKNLGSDDDVSWSSVLALLRTDLTAIADQLFGDFEINPKRKSKLVSV